MGEWELGSTMLSSMQWCGDLSCFYLGSAGFQTWESFLAPLYLATGTRRKVCGWVGVFWPGLLGFFPFTYIPVVSTQLPSNSPTINLRYMVSVPRRKGNGVGKLAALPWPDQSAPITKVAFLWAYFQVLRRSLAIEQMQSIVVKSMTSIQIPWIQIPPPSLIRYDKCLNLSLWLSFLIVKWG